MSRRAVIVLGVGQCLNWGVLYYAFTVLVLPVSRELRVDPWLVTAAFSSALLVSAALAPLAGAWTDRGAGPRLMEAGGWLAAALLAVWAWVPTLPVLFAAWVGLGACMAATLYEPAFAIVGRAVPDQAERLRALALVTVFGGVASTVFLPSADLLVRTIGWRPTVGVLAAVLAGSTVLTRSLVFTELCRDLPSPSRASAPTPTPVLGPVFWWTLTTFAFASFASAGLTANLVPALAERQISPSSAALLGGLFGLMQVPGRVLLSIGGTAGSPVRLISISLTLQAVGLLGFWSSRSVLVTAGGLLSFAAGAGLATLARPHFMQTHFGAHASAGLSGRVARWQQIARSAGPFVAAACAASASYGAILGAFGVIFLGLALAFRRVPNGSDDRAGPPPLAA